jgi:hypothetical protein
VFFHIGTLHEILSGLPPDVDSLYELGRRMGKSFGGVFVEYLKARKPEVTTIDAMIKEWCKYDISGGWGNWTLPESESNQIWVKNSFLLAVQSHKSDSTDIQTIKFNEKSVSRWCPIM